MNSTDHLQLLRSSQHEELGILAGIRNQALRFPLTAVKADNYPKTNRGWRRAKMQRPSKHNSSQQSEQKEQKRGRKALPSQKPDTVGNFSSRVCVQGCFVTAAACRTAKNTKPPTAPAFGADAPVLPPVRQTPGCSTDRNTVLLCRGRSMTTTTFHTLHNVFCL